MSRNKSRRQRTQRQPVASAPTVPAQAIPFNVESVNNLSIAAAAYAGFGMPKPTVNRNLPAGPPARGPGRPATDDYIQQTVPQVDPYRNGHPSAWGNYPEIVRRQPFPTSSFDNLQLSTVDPDRAFRSLPRISPIVAQGLRLLKRLANTDLIISVKNPDEKNRYILEDTEAVEYLDGLKEKTGIQVVSNIPGAMGSFKQFVDDLLTGGYVFGKMFGELALKPNRRDYSHLIAVDATTMEIRRDYQHVGAFKIGQRRGDVIGGWLELNPDLVTYVAVNGTGLGNLYGEPEMLTAFHVAPIWAGYFNKLAIYIQRAAFGFLDGVVKVEVLQAMWVNVKPEVKIRFAGGDFMVWANAMTKYLADSYKAIGESDPDQFVAHLDLLEIKGESSGKTTFPTEDAAHVVRTEYYNAIGAPGELFGEKSTPSDRFTDLKVEAYYQLLVYYQDCCLQIINRAFRGALWAKGWPRKIKVECKFAPIQIYDRLTLAQAVQIEDLVQTKRRDEGFQSQDEASMNTIGRPALVQHPLAAPEDSDTSGPSTPSAAVMLQRQAGGISDKQGGSTPGDSKTPGSPGSPGGADKKRQTDPAKDKRMEAMTLNLLSSRRAVH